MTLDEMKAKFAHWPEKPEECFYDFPDCPTIIFRLAYGRIELGPEPSGRITALLSHYLGDGKEIEIPDLERGTIDPLRERLMRARDQRVEADFTKVVGGEEQ